MKISGYLHVDKDSRLYETTVGLGYSMNESLEKLNGRRSCGLLPGRHGDWRQQPLIKSIFAACDDGTRRLEDWVGKSSGAVNRGGRPAKASQPAEEEGAPPPRTAQRRSRAAGRAGPRLCPVTRPRRQPSAQGFSRWTYLASATCAAQSCRQIGRRMVCHWLVDGSSS